MKTKIFNLIMVTILFAIGFSNCSNNDFNPEDYVSSTLSGEYGKGGYHLIPTEEGFIFSIEYIKKNKNIVITGTLDFGLMTLNINY